MNYKNKVLKRFPKAYCYMSQLSGMFFVKNRGRVLVWEAHPITAWRMAFKGLSK